MSEKEPRARQQQIHGLGINLKRRIHEADRGTDQHRELIRQLEALNQDNDASQTQWFDDLTAMHPLPPAPEQP